MPELGQMREAAGGVGGDEGRKVGDVAGADGESGREMLVRMTEGGTVLEFSEDKNRTEP